MLRRLGKPSHRTQYFARLDHHRRHHFAIFITLTHRGRYENESSVNITLEEAGSSRFIELLHLQLVPTPVLFQLLVLGDQIRNRDAHCHIQHRSHRSVSVSCRTVIYSSKQLATISWFMSRSARNRNEILLRHFPCMESAAVWIESRELDAIFHKPFDGLLSRVTNN